MKTHVQIYELFTYWLHLGIMEIAGDTTTKVELAKNTFRVRNAISGRTVIITWIVGIVIVVITSAIAFDGTVPDWERDLTLWFNRGPDWLFGPVWFVQQFGVLFAPVIAALILWFLTKEWFYLVPFSVLLGLKLFIEKAVVKNLVDRQRPFTSIGPEVNVRGGAFEGLSFPSGHTTTAFGLGMLLTAVVPPKWRPLPVAWAIATGISRLYFGEHNVLDVVAGAALGTMFAFALWYVFLNRRVEAA